MFNGGLKILSIVATICLAIGSFVYWVGSIASDQGDTKRRVQVMEERIKEDRKDIKDRLDKLEERAQRTDEGVQKLLQEIRIIQDRGERRR